MTSDLTCLADGYLAGVYDVCWFVGWLCNDFSMLFVVGGMRSDEGGAVMSSKNGTENGYHHQSFVVTDGLVDWYTDTCCQFFTPNTTERDMIDERIVWGGH